MPIINLTPLTIRLADENDDVFATFEPGDAPLHLQTTATSDIVDGVPVEQTRILSVEGLPEPREDTYYIVPEPVAHALNRPDLVTPDTGPSAIRDEHDRVYAVRRLFSVSMNHGSTPEETP